VADTQPSSTRNRVRGNGEGTVYYDRDKNRWIAKVTIDGKRRKKTATTEAAAKRLLRDLLREVDEGTTPTQGNITVRQLLDDWSTNALPARNLAPRSIEINQWAVTKLIEMIGPKRLRSLTAADVEKAFREADFARESYIKIRSVLGKALDYAMRRKLVTTNIARHVELPAEAPRTEPDRALTIEQAKTLLAVAETRRLYPIWLVMLTLGLRPGEATGLTWHDIDLDNAVIHIRRSLKLEDGRLNVDEHLKTRRSRRSLAAPPILTDALHAQRQRQADEWAAKELGTPGPDDLVFTTTEGTPIDPSNLRRQFAKLTNDAGLGNWHPHELRHSTASILSATGTPLEHIADTLGHDGTRMTALVYRHAITPTITTPTKMGDILRK
jgi:integrase